MKLDNILKNFREQIDGIDKEIIYLLSRRFELVKQIGHIKKDLGENIIQLRRWEELLNNLYIEAEERGIEKELVNEIWELIHKESLKIEKV